VTGQGLVVIVGAARSGTKLLRDCLGRESGISVVPYDMNLLWRLGNESLPHDEIPASSANPTRGARISRHLDRWRSTPILVEKTVSNTLRVPFVNALFPDALFVHLIRDGYDVVESSYRQWSASPSWHYMFKKLGSVPALVAPRYVLRAGRDALLRQFSSAQRTVPVWGPAYRGISEDLAKEAVLLVVARQWRLCVESSLSGLRDVPQSQQIQVRYEDVVADPDGEIRRVAQFCGVEAPRAVAGEVEIRRSEVGKGRRSLTEDQLAMIGPEIDATQGRLGFH
jgi:hypothetical protein